MEHFMINYQNKYGKATLTPVSEVLRVQDVSYAKMPQLIEQVKFSIDQAEKLALITGNKKIQIAFCMDKKLCYVLHHLTPSTVQICSVEMDYIDVQSMTPAEVIMSLRVPCPLM
jgi:hypothetical protein